MKQLFIALLLLLISLAGTPAWASFIDQTCPDQIPTGAVYNIQSYEPVGQEFVPSTSGLAGIAISIADLGGTGGPVTVLVREGTIDGLVLPGAAASRDMPSEGWEYPFAEFLFPDPVILIPGQTYVFEVVVDSNRWGIRATDDVCYEPGSMVLNGNLIGKDLRFRTLGDNLSPISSRLYCYPTWGTVPLTSSFSLRLWHDHEGQTRTIAGHIDLTLGNGQFLPNFRAGYTNVHYGNPRVVIWWLNLPAIYPMLGTNLFEFVGQDVTPAPWNQPPYAPSGDTDTDFCEILILGGGD